MSKARKLIRRKVPPRAASDDGSESEGDAGRSASRLSAPDAGFARAPSTEPETDYSDYYEDEEEPPHAHVDGSERDLMARLELAKRNSRAQREAQYDPRSQLQEVAYDNEECEYHQVSSLAYTLLMTFATRRVVSTRQA